MRTHLQLGRANRELHEARDTLEMKVAARTAALAQANEELKALNEEKADFLAIAAHDLRAPLISLQGYAGILSSSLDIIQSALNSAWPHLDESQQQEISGVIERDVPESLAFITAATNRIDQLIIAILKLSRLGRRELRPEPIEMKPLVEAALSTLAFQVEQHQATVTVGALPDVIADRSSMEIIVQNLLMNAVAYLDPARPGVVEVFGERHRQETIIRIRDNGRGIAPEDLGKIFKIFGRVGKQDVPGEGMGLAYVQTLLRRHGGRIWCESQPGVGATFSFTLPHPTPE
jgi:signal transduction histidine kinase